MLHKIVTQFTDASGGPAPSRRGMGAVLCLCLAFLLGGCNGGGSVNIANSQLSDPATADFPIFYVKRTIPKNSDDLRMMRQAVPQADLYMRSSASPAAPETNITARITAGAAYDIKDVNVSPDGKKVCFAMRGPLTANMNQMNPPSWRIYEYVIASNTLTPMIDPTADTAPNTVNDVAPAYLPDGRMVFSSTRQKSSQAILINEGKPQFIAQNEARTEPAFELHVISADRTQIDQVDFNPSDDRDPTVLSDGRILFTRWNHIPGKDQMDLYTINPDGTHLQLYYGAQSHMTGTNGTVVQFVHAHEMQDGRILAITRQYTGVDFGGALQIIDGAHYVENTQPLLAYPTLTGPAQTSATSTAVSTIPGPSPGGRFNSAWPLWDGTGRILVSWSQCRVLDNTQGPPAIVPCTAQRLADPTVQIAPPLYSVWLFDPAQNNFLPIMTPTEGVMITDVAAAQPRPTPTVIPDSVPDPELKGEGVGEIDIKSVYDFDGVDTAPGGIGTLADGKTPATQRPARFIRLVKAVSIPDKTVINLAAEAFGVTDDMREIMGYAPVQPDGSVRIKVPADVAFYIEILDANARRVPAFPQHSDWLQIRAGEVLACNGCHTPPTPAKPFSHGRDSLFNAAYAGAASGGVPFADSVATYLPQAGQTMAQALARVSCSGSALSTAQCSMTPSIDVFYTDQWTDTSQLPANPAITFRYMDLTKGEIAPIPAATPGCEAAWASNCRIVINYPESIQSLWDAVHPVNDPKNGMVSESCASAGCHDANDAKLDLTNTPSNDDPAELVSYRNLLIAHNVPGPVVNGQPTTVSVGPYLDAGEANGPDSTAALALFAPGSGDKIHAGALTGAELRLIAEWLDIGAQNFNDPFDPNVPKN